MVARIASETALNVMVSMAVPGGASGWACSREIGGARRTIRSRSLDPYRKPIVVGGMNKKETSTQPLRELIHAALTQARSCSFQGGPDRLQWLSFGQVRFVLRARCAKARSNADMRRVPCVPAFPLGRSGSSPTLWK